jgi:hypothetical protein
MWYLTDIAEWFEKNKSRSELILDQWVEDSGYSNSTMIAASTTKAFMTVGSGLVDLLRIGDGVKEGTLRGAGEDTLRLVAIFPVGKSISLLKSYRGTIKAKFVLDTGGPNCFWIASAKGLAQINHSHNGKVLASVTDVAKALGMDMNALWRIPNLATGISFLKRLGAQVGSIRKVTSLEDIAKFTPRDGSIVMTAVRIIRDGQVIGGHAVYVFRNTLGQIRIMDRSVGQVINGSTQGVFKSFDDFSHLYRADKIVPYEAAVVKNIFSKSILHDTPKLLIPVLGVMAEEK